MEYSYSLRLSSLVFLAFLAPSAAQSQAPDPAALIHNATSEGSLESDAVTPFSLQANFLVNDYLGAPSSAGRVTISVIKPGVRGATYTESSPTSLNSENRFADDFMRHLLLDMLLHPAASASMMSTSKLKVNERKIGQITMPCVTFEDLQSSPDTVSKPREIDCLAADKPLVRLVWLEYGFEVIFNNFVSFDGRTFAKEVTIQEQGRVRARLSVTNLTVVPNLQASDLPNSASEYDFEGMDRAFTLDTTASHRPKLLKQISPQFPAGDKSKQSRVAVFMRVHLNLDGSVGNVAIITSPSASFADSARTAVRQWRFWPLSQYGNDHETALSIQMAFTKY